MAAIIFQSPSRSEKAGSYHSLSKKDHISLHLQMKRRKDYLCTPVAEGILTFLVIPAKNEILTENTENGDVLIWK